MPGRIQTVGSDEEVGLYIISDWSVKKVSKKVMYLVKNANYTYKWVPSRNGASVENAVIVGQRAVGDFWQAGRVQIGGFSYMAKVHPNFLTHYESGDGKEVAVEDCEVLTCNVYDDSVIEDKSNHVLVIISCFVVGIAVLTAGFFILNHFFMLRCDKNLLFRRF